MIRFDEDDPSIAWAGSRSHAGVEHQIRGVESLWPRCSCEAARWGVECGHIVELLTILLAEMKEGVPEHGQP